MKFKLFIAAISFIPALVMAEGAPKIAPPVVAGTPGANGGGISKPAAAPVAVKPTPAQPKPAAAPVVEDWARR